MAAKTLAVGDIVQLKSGGPNMTVAVLTGTSVRCKWFAGAKLEDGHFDMEMLQAPEPKKGASKKSETE
jgi:uncharacterized protein YodC (DUF2158 family)